MGDVQIDFNAALETISERLGVASEQIIEEYTKYVKTEALRHFMHGAVLALIPVVFFVFDFSTVDEKFAFWLLHIARLSASVALFIYGIDFSLSYIEDFCHPKAEAIHRLLQDVGNII